MRSASRLLAAVVVLLLAAARPALDAQADGLRPCDLETNDRIVAIGDVHGAYERFVAILRSTGLVDGRQRWSGGRAVLVQTGDVLDRGSDSRRVLELLRRLENEASRAGGRVVALLGNHEIMNMMGDLRYVSAGEYAAFRTPDSTDLRDRLYQIAAANAENRARGSNQPFDEREFRKLFFDATPLGSVELQLAFAPRGEYGPWLRGHPAVARVNGVVFVHGGISPADASLGCEGINKAVAAELTAPAEVVAAGAPADRLSTREDGPLWYRGLALGSESELGPAVQAMLDQLNARAIVIGHTVTETRRIATRFGGRVIQIDTGMLSGDFFPNGRASAIEIRNGRVTAVYEDGRRELPALPPTPPARPSPAPVRSPAGAR
jgi:hypothetical protein